MTGCRAPSPALPLVWVERGSGIVPTALFWAARGPVSSWSNQPIWLCRYNRSQIHAETYKLASHGEEGRKSCPESQFDMLYSRNPDQNSPTSRMSYWYFPFLGIITSFVRRLHKFRWQQTAIIIHKKGDVPRTNGEPVDAARRSEQVLVGTKTGEARIGLRRACRTG